MRIWTDEFIRFTKVEKPSLREAISDTMTLIDFRKALVAKYGKEIAYAALREEADEALKEVGK